MTSPQDQPGESQTREPQESGPQPAHPGRTGIVETRRRSGADSGPTQVVPPRQQNRDNGQYAGRVQPPPGFSPQSGPPPHESWQQAGPGYGQRPSDAGYSSSPGLNRPPSQPEHGRQPGYQPAGYGQPGYAEQPGYAPQPSFGQQPGYGQQPGFAHQAAYGQQTGLGQPGYGQGGYYTQPGGPSTQQIATWAALGTVALLSGLAAILTLVLCLDISSAVNRASNMCGQYTGEIAQACREAMNNSGVHVPAAMTIYLILLTLGGVAAVIGAVLLFLKKAVGQFLILGGGVALLLFAIIFEAQYAAAGRITYDLIAGLFIATAGGLMFVPQVRQFLGLPPLSSGSTGARPGQYGGHFGGGQFGAGAPYGGQFGAGAQLPYGQPQPGQYGHQQLGGYPPRQW